MRSFAVRVLACTAVVFSVWAGARLAVLHHTRATYSYDERWIRLLTDFEIHSLTPRFGWDLATIPALAALTVLLLLRHEMRVRTTVFAATTTLSAVLAFGMALFPAAALGGHLHTRLKTYVGQSVAFAAMSIGLMVVSASALHFLARRRLPAS